MLWGLVRQGLKCEGNNLRILHWTNSWILNYEKTNMYEKLSTYYWLQTNFSNYWFHRNTQTHLSAHAVHKNNTLHMCTIWSSELWLSAHQRPKHQVFSRYTEHNSVPLAQANYAQWDVSMLCWLPLNSIQPAFEAPIEGLFDCSIVYLCQVLDVAFKVCCCNMLCWWIQAAISDFISHAKSCLLSINLI